MHSSKQYNNKSAECIVLRLYYDYSVISVNPDKNDSCIQADLDDVLSGLSAINLIVALAHFN